MENINKQFEQLYILLELTEFQSDLIKKLHSDVQLALHQPLVISSVCDIHKGTRCEKSFPSYTDGKCRECGGQAN